MAFSLHGRFIYCGRHDDGVAKTVARIPWVNLGNLDRLGGSYVCPNHKQQLSSVY